MLPALLVLLVVSGCGDETAPEPAPAAEVTTEDSPVRLVDSDEADLLLFVSNQSFEDPKVEIEVVVDGVTVVDGEFAVGNQHHWVEFPLALVPGRHEVTVRAGSGATLSESFVTPGDERRHAVIDHWGRGEDATLTWNFQTEPIHFA